MVLLLGVSVILLLTGETLSRLVIPPPILYRAPQVFFERREKPLGWEMRPHQESFTQAAPVHTNALGFRDHEIATPKPPGTTRLIAIGDSLTFGAGVEAGSAWPKRLERALRTRRAATSIEVVNAGVEAYWTRQEVELLRRRGLALDPDLVMIGFYWNDMPQHGLPGEPLPPEPPAPAGAGPPPRDTGAAPGAAGTAGQGPATWGLLDREGHILGRSWIPLELRSFLKRSRFLFALKQAADRFRFTLSPRKESLWMDAVLAGRTTPRIDDAWRRVRRALADAVTLSREHDFRLFLAAFPIPGQILEDHPAALYPRRILEICDELSIPALDLLPVFRDGAAHPEDLFIRWDGHPTPLAHALAAEAIADTLLARSILPVR